MSSDGTYEVVWPRGRQTVGNVPYAKRLDTLEGKVVGELWDWAFRGREIFPLLRKYLSARYPGVRFVDFEVFGSTHGADEAENIAGLPEKLAANGCDAVISGVGC